MGDFVLIVILFGFFTGLAFIPAYEWAHFRIIRVWSPYGSILRTLLVLLLATLVACVASAAVIFVPAYLIGIVPLRENTPYFGWSFATGGLTMRALMELRKRRRVKV